MRGVRARDCDDGAGGSFIRAAKRLPTRLQPLDPAANGVLTVDLDAIVANWRKLEERGVPAECAAVVKANAYGCGIEPVTRALNARRLQDILRRDAG